MVESDSEIPVANLNSPNAPHELLQAARSNGFIFVEHYDLELKPAEVQNLFDIVRCTRHALLSSSEPLSAL